MLRLCMAMYRRCLQVGILHKTDKGQIVFPFDAVHVAFF